MAELLEIIYPVLGRGAKNQTLSSGTSPYSPFRGVPPPPPPLEHSTRVYVLFEWELVGQGLLMLKLDSPPKIQSISPWRSKQTMPWQPCWMTKQKVLSTNMAATPLSFGSSGIAGCKPKPTSYRMGKFLWLVMALP